MVGEEAMDGSVAWLDMSVPGEEGSKNLGKKLHKLGKGERWNVRGGAEQLRSEPTQTDARFEKFTSGEKQTTTTRKMGVAGW